MKKKISLILALVMIMSCLSAFVAEAAYPLSFAGKISIKAGETTRWTTNQWVWLTSGNPGVATINSYGYITAHKAGQTNITATAANGVKKTVTITVQ